jgi:ketosteroid isomerase-like protein
MDPKAVVIAWVHAWNAGDLEGVLALYDEPT